MARDAARTTSGVRFHPGWAAAMAAVAALVVGSQTGWAQQAGEERGRTFGGELVEVDEDQERLVIRTDDDKQYAVRLGNETEIRVDGKPAELDDLQKGMTVQIVLDQQGRIVQKVQASRQTQAQQGRERLERSRTDRQTPATAQQDRPTQDQRQQTLRGEVVQAREDQLVIRTEEGQQRTIRTEDRTDVRLDGREVDIENLERGMQVQITLDQQGRAAQRIQASRQDRTPQTDRQREQVGQQQRSQQEQTRRPLEPLGQQERGQQTLRGEVVQAREDQLVIRTEDGQQRTIRTEDRTDVRLDGREVDVEDLDRGMQVQITLDQQGQIAQRIQASRQDRAPQTDRQREQVGQQQRSQQEQTRRPLEPLGQQERGQQTLRGEVVQAREDQLVIRTEDGQQRTIRTEDRTDVRLDGREVDVEDLDRGMQVQITLDQQGQIAQRIQASRQDRAPQTDRQREQFGQQQRSQQEQLGQQERGQQTLRGEVVQAREDQLIIRIDRRDADLEELRRGTQVQIILDREGDRVQTRRFEERPSERFNDRQRDRFDDRRSDDRRFDNRRTDDRDF